MEEFRSLRARIEAHHQMEKERLDEVLRQEHMRDLEQLANLEHVILRRADVLDSALASLNSLPSEGDIADQLPRMVQNWANGVNGHGQDYNP